MVEDALDDSGIFDAGDDLHRTATYLAGFNVDVEHALEALRPAHGGAALDGCFGTLGTWRFAAATGGGVRCAVWTVRGEHAVVADEVDAEFGNECREGRTASMTSVGESALERMLSASVAASMRQISVWDMRCLV